MPGDRVVRNDQGEMVLVRPIGRFYDTGYKPILELERDMPYLMIYGVKPDIVSGDRNESLPRGPWSDWFKVTTAPIDPVQRGNAIASTEKILGAQGIHGQGKDFAESLFRRPAFDNPVLAMESRLHQMLPDSSFSTLANFRISDSQVTPMDQLARDARNSAMVAANQLKGDVSALEVANQEIERDNLGAQMILATAVGRDFHADRKAWEEWFVDQLGYAMVSRSVEKPTVVEEVPVEYQPEAVTTIDRTYTLLSRVSCFGAGTMIRSIDGPRAIETLAVGDRVLTQSTATGKLGYRPIVFVHRNPPSPTFRVDLAGKPVIASPFHRFWKAGRGWVMARDLTVGDTIRTLGGVARVTAFEADKVQPVFNLDVAEDADFFAGEAAALVHDNSLPDLRQAPFDRPASLASKP